MKLRLFALLLLPALVGCATTPIAVAETNNPEIRAELLFEHEGCRIYRFRDGRIAVYYADCPQSASTSWHVQDGTNSTRPVLVSTVTHPAP